MIGVRSPTPRALLATAALALLTACGAPAAPPAASPASGPASSSSAVPTVSPTSPAVAAPATGSTPGTVAVPLKVRDGAVVGGVRRAQVPLGADVVLLVDSDVEDEVHLHGYDEKGEVAAGGTEELTFLADVPGVFEVELERSGVVLVRLQVR